jgi:hypothetical protein
MAQVFGGNTVSVEDAFKDTSTGVASLETGLAAGRYQVGNEAGKAIGIDDPGRGRNLVVGDGSDLAPEKVDKTKVASLGALGQMEFEAPTVDGCLEGAKIAAIVKARLRGLQDCYEKELKRAPSLAGRITVAFTITGVGAVSEARVEADSMGSPAVGDCLARRLRQMKFPKSECASVSVSYPFIFVKSQ